MPIISLQEVTKSYVSKYFTVTALDQITLDINPGEMVAIMGPSGSGKSTLMNVIGLLDRPSKGKLILGDEQIHLDMSDRKLAMLRNQKIGFVFQSYNLLPRLNTLNNVLLPMQYAKNKSTQDRAIQILEQVGLAKRTHHLPGQLSGGEKQRVAIARSLINNPGIILADEPTGNLDSKSGDEIMNLLADLNRNGRTVLIVTHDESIANRCGRIIRLLDGKIINKE